MRERWGGQVAGVGLMNHKHESVTVRGWGEEVDGAGQRGSSLSCTQIHMHCHTFLFAGLAGSPLLLLLSPRLFHTHFLFLFPSHSFLGERGVVVLLFEDEEGEGGKSNGKTMEN